MQGKLRVSVLLVVAGLVVATAAIAQDRQRTRSEEGRSAQKMDAQKKNFDVKRHTRAWSDTSKQAANAMVEKYGTPDGITDTMLVWNDKGPFKRTIVHREAIEHRFPMPHKDVLEQTIDYDVPVEMADDLALYDGSVIVDRTPGLLSARCDTEAANILALNLADDVVTGRKTVQQARDEYARAILEVKEGKKPAITSRLMFDLKPGATGAPDRPHRTVMADQPSGTR